jgi:hypothetical protein
MSISSYLAGFYARLDSLTQLQMPDELKGHLLLNQANFGPTEKYMIRLASAKGSLKIAALVDSMRQLFGDRQDIPTNFPLFATSESEKRFCNYCKKKIHIEEYCWKEKKALRELGSASSSMPGKSQENLPMSHFDQLKIQYLYNLLRLIPERFTQLSENLLWSV